jgi:hypothetical protein
MDVGFGSMLLKRVWECPQSVIPVADRSAAAGAGDDGGSSGETKTVCSMSSGSRSRRFAKELEERDDILRLSSDLLLEDDGAVAIDDAHVGSFKRHVDACKVATAKPSPLTSPSCSPATSTTPRSRSTRHRCSHTRSNASAHNQLASAALAGVAALSFGATSARKC